jgi:K+-transporting ATPase ATPase C chain
MSTARMRNHNFDANEHHAPHTQAEPWIRLAVVMVAPVLLLLVGMSLTHKDGQVIGSELIGQPFTSPKDFWSRPSATVDANSKPLPYNGANSGGSNLAPSNPDLKKAVEERIAALRAADPETTGPVPVDLVTTSASGLDPHISPAAAAFQVHRVAKARGLDEAKVHDLIAAHTEGAQWGVLGDARVNVLKLNMALDGLTSK